MEKIVDTTQSQVQLIESVSESDGGKRHRARFLVSRADEKNGNGRLYPRHLWERESQKVAEGKAVITGQSKHPNLDIDVLDTFLRFDTLQMAGRDLWGEALVMETSKGRDFIEIAKTAPEIISVSTRGRGTMKKGKDESGNEVQVIQDDYELEGIDIIFKGYQSFKDGSMLAFEALAPETASAPAETPEGESKTENEPVVEIKPPAAAPQLEEADKTQIEAFLKTLLDADAKLKEEYDDDVWRLYYDLHRMSDLVSILSSLNDGANVDTIVGKVAGAVTVKTDSPLGKLVSALKTTTSEALEGLSAAVITTDYDKIIGQYSKALDLAKDNTVQLEKRIAFAENEALSLCKERDELKASFAQEQEAHNETKAVLARTDNTVKELSQQRAARDFLVTEARGEKWFAGLIAALWECKTVEEVKARLPDEKARLEAQLARLSPDARAVLVQEQAPAPEPQNESKDWRSGIKRRRS